MTPEEYVRMHQKAFRVAFDFLTQHFPPGTDPEWWVQSAQEVSQASIAAGETELVNELLIAVYNYLGHEHERRKQDGTDD